MTLSLTLVRLAAFRLVEAGLEAKLRTESQLPCPSAAVVGNVC